jgi:hypothetical protein
VQGPDGSWFTPYIHIYQNGEKIEALLDVIAFIIQFNSIVYYLCAESTATRPITDTAQYRYT